ncbi:MAG: GAF domain-containing protein [Chloroflexi bacterium]|nr:GAF domain-containing protein [Chloroflexota bacterium]
MPTDQQDSARALQLVLALDRARDTLHDDGDPNAMFLKLAELLKQDFEAEGCAIVLVAETSDDIECVASAGLPDAVCTQLCRQAMDLPTPAPLPDSRWAYTLGVQIILDDFPLGGIVLVRDSQPFSEQEIARLSLAETQIDSAVIQARTVWKLNQRNRELEAIFEIDRLRDRTANESELISGFTTILLHQYRAELCLLLLTHVDSGEMIVRGVVDRFDLNSPALEHIRRHATDIRIPQVIPAPDGIGDLNLLAAPFIVAGARLGAVVVGRELPFSIGDHRLLHALMSQMDSAIVFSRIYHQLSLRKRELETIYRIDRIRDREKDFDALLQSVLNELCEAISSEIGFIMLYKAGEKGELELRSATVEGQITAPGYQEIIHRIARQAVDQAELVFTNQPDGPVRSAIAVPLILNENIIGVFGALNSTRARGFDAEDRRILVAITSQVDTAIFERLEQRRMRTLLSRSVDPKVLEHLLRRADTNLLDGERVVLSVLFADLRGSTEWAERVEPEELVKTLNLFLGRMTDVIFKYGGTLDKFVGDEVIGLFGTPVKMEDHAFRAVQAGIEMQNIHQELQRVMAAQGRELPFMGVGISSGEAIAGEFGHPVRSEFTALGRIVNLGARLCGVAEGGEILISQNTYQTLDNLIVAEELEDVSLKGIQQPARVFRVVGLKNAQGLPQ